MRTHPECGHEVLAGDGTVEALTVLTCTLPAGHQPSNRHHDGDAAFLAETEDDRTLADRATWRCVAGCTTTALPWRSGPHLFEYAPTPTDQLRS